MPLSGVGKVVMKSGLTLLQFWNAGRQRDLLLVGRIAQRERQVLAQRQAKSQAAAECPVLVGLVVGLVRLLGEQVDAEQHALVEEVGLGEGQFEPARILPVLDRRLGVLTATEQVALGDAYLGEEAFGGRIAARDREFAGRLLLDVDIDHDPVGRRAGLVRDLDGLEEVEVLEPPLGAVDQDAIVGIALGDLELAPDHVVAGACVAADVEALDVDARALLHHERHVDDTPGEIAVAARTHLRESIAAPRQLDGHVLDRLFHQLGVVHPARIASAAGRGAQRDRRRGCSTARRPRRID